MENGRGESEQDYCLKIIRIESQKKKKQQHVINTTYLTNKPKDVNANENVDLKIYTNIL